jgi:hypothetical protein
MSDGGGKTYKQGRLVMGRAVAIVKNGETGRKMAGKLVWSDARGGACGVDWGRGFCRRVRWRITNLVVAAHW